VQKILTHPDTSVNHLVTHWMVDLGNKNTAGSASGVRLSQLGLAATVTAAVATAAAAAGASHSALLGFGLGGGAQVINPGLEDQVFPGQRVVEVQLYDLIGDRNGDPGEDMALAILHAHGATEFDFEVFGEGRQRNVDFKLRVILPVGILCLNMDFLLVTNFHALDLIFQARDDIAVPEEELNWAGIHFFAFHMQLVIQGNDDIIVDG
jgi:hypothetical protein